MKKKKIEKKKKKKKGQKLKHVVVSHQNSMHYLVSCFGTKLAANNPQIHANYVCTIKQNNRRLAVPPLSKGQTPTY